MGYCLGLVGQTFLSAETSGNQVTRMFTQRAACRQRLAIGNRPPHSVPGRGPLPVFAPLNQASFHWVLLDVLDNAKQLVVVTGDVVVRFILPKLTVQTQQSIALVGRVPFHALHDSFVGQAFQPAASLQPTPVPNSLAG